MKERSCAFCHQPIVFGNAWGITAAGEPVHQVCPGPPRGLLPPEAAQDETAAAILAVANRLGDRAQQLSDAGVDYDGAQVDERGAVFRFHSDTGDHEIRFGVERWQSMPPDLLARGIASHVLLEVDARRRALREESGRGTTGGDELAH